MGWFSNHINQCLIIRLDCYPIGVYHFNISFEVFNRFDHPDYVADNSAFAYDVVTRVNSKSLRVLYDIYHMLRMEEDVEKTLFDKLPCQELPGSQV